MTRCESCPYYKPGKAIGICTKYQEFMAPNWGCDNPHEVNEDEEEEDE